MHTTTLQNQAAAVHRKNQREITGKDEVSEGTTAPQPVEETPVHVEPVLVPIEQVAIAAPTLPPEAPQAEAVAPTPTEEPQALPQAPVEAKKAKEPKDPKEPKVTKVAKKVAKK